MATMATGMDMTPSRSPMLRGRLSAAAERRNRELMERQRVARRGPTPEAFFAKDIDNSRIEKVDDVARIRDMRLFATALGVLFVLVMVFLVQHLSAIEIGYQIEDQKHQVELLREQNRQLRLTEAQLSDPVRIDHMARQLGLGQPQPGQVVRPNGAESNAPVLAQVSTPVLRAN